MPVEQTVHFMSTSASRKIIHVDMDAFYASVEMRDNPALRGKPVVVGGSPESRGVVAAASYEARAFGVRSAMPASQARRICPQAVFLPPDFTKYRAASAQIRAIFHQYTDLVEPVSLDEAYLDVTENKVAEPSATKIAQQIKTEIFAQTGLTASAGVSVNKFLAKIASDERKPNGLFVVRPEEVKRFLEHLPVKKVPGIGRVTQQLLAEHGLDTCGQMLAMGLAELERHFGRRGREFYLLAQGIDDRPVVPHRPRKSISIEDTFSEDHDEPEWLLDRLKELSEGLEKRTAKAGVRGRTVTLKLRLSDFQIRTRSKTGEEFISDGKRIFELGRQLYTESGLVGQKLRLIGIGLSQLEGSEENHEDEVQLSLPFPTEPG